MYKKSSIMFLLKNSNLRFIIFILISFFSLILFFKLNYYYYFIEYSNNFDLGITSINNAKSGPLDQQGRRIYTPEVQRMLLRKVILTTMLEYLVFMTTTYIFICFLSPDSFLLTVLIGGTAAGFYLLYYEEILNPELLHFIIVDEPLIIKDVHGEEQVITINRETFVKICVEDGQNRILNTFGGVHDSSVDKYISDSTPRLEKNCNKYCDFWLDYQQNYMKYLKELRDKSSK